MAERDLTLHILSATTRCRHARMAQLIEQYRGRIDVAVGQQFLSDHRNLPQSICAHPREGVKPAGKTLASIVFQPAQGAIHIAHGNGCQVPYRRYTFDGPPDTQSS